jgi:peroxiredoxin Q/BCP
LDKLDTDNRLEPAWHADIVDGLVIATLRRPDNVNSGRTNVARFEVGDNAPDFSATTYDGNKIRLVDFLGKRALVLFFYPKDGTPICTQEVCAFRDSYEKFIDAGAEVIGVSSDTKESHHAFARQHKLSFPLISDVDGSLRKAFAVPKAMGLFPGRVTYVIDQAGIIRQIFSAQFASDEHVREALIALGAATRASQ